MLDANGTWSGFDVEVARAYARDRNRPLELIEFQWPELDFALERGDFDVVMSGVTVRADRLAVGAFTTTVAATDAVLVAPKGSPAPRRVVVNRGGHLERVARAAFDADDTVELTVIDDNRQLLAMVEEGAADGAVTDRLELRSTGEGLEVVAVLSSDQKAYWAMAANVALARDLDAWLVEKEADGTLPALRARYFGEADAGGLAPAAARVVDLVGRRLMLMPAVAEAKHAGGLAIDDPARERVVEERATAAAPALCLAPAPYVAFVRAQIEAAKAVQRATPVEDDVAPAFTLDELRGAIDRVDGALGAALTAAVPIGASAADVQTALRRAAPRGTDPTSLDAIAAALAALAQAPCLPPSQQVSMMERQRLQMSLPRSSITGPSHTGHASRHTTASPVVAIDRS